MITTELGKKAEVATLLTIIGEGTQEVFAKFKWDGEEE